MEEKVLVAYATRYGSTREVAEEIGKTLLEEGIGVDVMRADEVKDITPYTRVVIGSPIYAGKWLADAHELVKRFRAELEQVSVAFFAVGILMVDDTPEHRRKVEAALDPAVKMVAPDSVGLFAGRLDPKDLSFPLRMVLKVMGTPEGDYRDWEGIRTWAKGLLAGT